MKVYSVCIAFSLLAAVQGFTARPLASTLRKVSALNSMALPLDDDATIRYFLAKARECAYSDASTATEARSFLNWILEFESGCASGELVGNSMCNNVDEIADTVAHLRTKLDDRDVQERPALPIVFVVPITAILTILLMIGLTTIDWRQSDALPYTIEEWVWATKGGYLHTMFTHYLKNGGL